jgi:hypothetical protein
VTNGGFFNGFFGVDYFMNVLHAPQVAAGRTVLAQPI